VIIERRRGRPVGSTNTNRINTSARREPLAFERNIEYTQRGRGRGGRGRRRARGGRLQTSSRGSSTQISSRGALQATTQSNQLT